MRIRKANAGHMRLGIVSAKKAVAAYGTREGHFDIYSLSEDEVSHEAEMLRIKAYSRTYDAMLRKRLVSLPYEEFVQVQKAASSCKPSAEEMAAIRMQRTLKKLNELKELIETQLEKTSGRR